MAKKNRIIEKKIRKGIISGILCENLYDIYIIQNILDIRGNIWSFFIYL